MVRLHEAATALNDLIDSEPLLEREEDDPSRFTDEGVDNYDDILGISKGDLEDYLIANVHELHDNATQATVYQFANKYGTIPPPHVMANAPYLISAQLLRQGIQLGIMYSRLRAEEMRQQTKDPPPS